MQKLVIALMLAATVTMAGCSSDDDNDEGGAQTPTPTSATLDDVISRSADSRPVDDGLDQVNADLMNLFGDANTPSVELDEDETVASFVKKQKTVR